MLSDSRSRTITRSITSAFLGLSLLSPAMAQEPGRTPLPPTGATTNRPAEKTQELPLDNAP
ncbi:MAG: hypothetical protein QF412_07035, partial [Planctomycetota bacterium]|nr:hypothetical protein [Planctomycetota bacterium]